jgi:predicted GNAT family N-acyltransferase
MESRLKIARYAYGEKEYTAAWELREAVLRRPLGLSLEGVDLSEESHYWHFGAFDETSGEILGTVFLIPQEGAFWRLRQMAVRPDLQGRGIGRHLVLGAIAAARAAGASGITLHARAEAIGFYERLGFRSVGNPFLEVGIEHQTMSRALADESVA